MPCRERSPWWVPGLGVGAVALGHWAAYLLVAPNPADRSALLYVTGHGYWPWFAATGAVGAGLGFMYFVARRMRRRMEGAPGQVFRSNAGRLIAMQATSFLLIELMERVVVGNPKAIFGEPAIVVGVVLQVILGVAVALFLALTTRLVDRLVGSAPAWVPAPAELRTVRYFRTAPYIPSVPKGSFSVRGPPLTA